MESRAPARWGRAKNWAKPLLEKPLPRRILNIEILREQQGFRGRGEGGEGGGGGAGQKPTPVSPP